MPLRIRKIKPLKNNFVFNPEKEEKPIANAQKFISEDYHGGNEITFSIPDSDSLSSCNPKNGEFCSYSNSKKSDSRFATHSDKLLNSNSEEESDEENEEFQEKGNLGHCHMYNTKEGIQLDDLIPISYYKNKFYEFVDRIAEDKTNYYTFSSNDELNIKRLLLRPVERKPLNHYRQSRERETVILILDNSGSMTWWAENLLILSSLALSRNDVEIFIAPNGEILYRLTKKAKIPIDHDTFMKLVKHRKIIYVGDFDGANTPIELSWANDVIWVCTEDRYRNFGSHDWVSYSEKEFKGVFIRAWNLDEMFDAFRKINRFYKLWIDYHANDKFNDD